MTFPVTLKNLKDNVTSQLVQSLIKQFKEEDNAAVQVLGKELIKKWSTFSPRTACDLHERASFISQSDAPVVKKKKKEHLPKIANMLTSPTMTPPNLQFYKDTLDVNKENLKKEEPQKESCSDEKGVEKEAIEPTSKGGGDPLSNNEASNTSANNEESKETPSGPNEVRSILSHGRKRGVKKSVRFVEENNIKEVFYFEMDETERIDLLCSLPSNSNLCQIPTAQNISSISSTLHHLPRASQNMVFQADWRTLDRVQDQYFGWPVQNGNYNMMPMQEQAPGMRLKPRMMRPPMPKGPPPRTTGPRPRNIHRIPCHHFIPQVRFEILLFCIQV